MTNNFLGYELLIERQSNSYSTLNPPWYGDLESSFENHQNIVIGIQNLAINVLYAELLMCSCEKQGVQDNPLSSNIVKVKMMLPYLLKAASVLSESQALLPELYEFVIELRVRIEWLAAVFYEYFSKSAGNLNDEKEAEKLAMKHIENAISTMKIISSDLVIKTPQLESRGRSGNHWIELSINTLTEYKDEIESSTLLSHSRQKYFDLFSSWKKIGLMTITEIAGEDKERLELIGSELFKRYQLVMDKMDIGKHTDELIDEFITIHKCHLSPSHDNEDDSPFSSMWPSLWNFLPTSKDSVSLDDLTNSSFVTLLCLSLLFKRDSRVCLASFIGSLILVVSKKYCLVLLEMDALNNEDSTNQLNAIGHDNNYSSDHFRQKRGIGYVIMLRQMIHFLVSKLWNLFQQADPDEIKGMVKAINLNGIIQLSIEISSGQSPLSMKKPSKENQIVPQCVELLKTSLCFGSMIRNTCDEKQSRNKFTSEIFGCLCIALVRERSWMPCVLPKGSNRIERYEKVKLYDVRSEYVSIIAIEFGTLLSMSRNEEHLVVESFLINDLITIENQNSASKMLNPLVKLIESLTWFWKFLSNNELKSVESFLRIPIAAAISSLIGCCGYANSSTITSAFSQILHHESKVSSISFSLSDCFESDDSVKRYLDTLPIGHDDDKLRFSRRLLLHALCRSVQCIGLVFCCCDDSDITSMTKSLVIPNENGDFLALIVSKILGDISDFVLEEYCESRDQISLWNENYPFGFRTSGLQLDALLHKAYRCLFGINLTSQNSYNHLPSDYVVPTLFTGAFTPMQNKRYSSPDSVKSSAQLYRCIMRAYTGGRRTIPTDALECVSSALPPIKESPVLAAIKIFVSQKQIGNSLHSIESTSDLLEPGIDSDITSTLPSWLLEEINQHHQDEINDEEFIVRKGICEYFAQGSLPCMGSSSLSKPEESGVSRERDMATQTEKAICKKFNYLIESLNYEPKNASKWYRAGLCLGVKIDILMDRLANVRDAYNDEDFYLKGFCSLNQRETEFQKPDNKPHSLSSLLEKQYNEYMEAMKLKDIVLGESCFMYLDRQWSCFNSLKDFYNFLGKEILLGNNLNGQQDEIGFNNTDTSDECLHWSIIQSYYEEGSFSQWQVLLGKMFVTALQMMREKCFKAAFYFSTLPTGKGKDNLFAEISESIGTVYYSDISHSPRKLTSFEIRQRAKLALAYFETALRSIQQNEEEAHDLVEYELHFMIGKVSILIFQSLLAFFIRRVSLTFTIII